MKSRQAAATKTTGKETSVRMHCHRIRSCFAFVQSSLMTYVTDRPHVGYSPTTRTPKSPRMNLQVTFSQDRKN